MQIFERNGECDLVAHYEYFLMNYDWSQRSLPDQIGDWNLLGGQYRSDDDGFIGLSAVFQSFPEDRDLVVYLELSQDMLVKMVVGQSVEEITSEIPAEILEQVHLGSRS